MELLLLLMGAVIGFALCIIIFRKTSVGVLRIIDSDSDGPYFFLELAADPSYVAAQEKIFLTVRRDNFISRK